MEEAGFTNLKILQITPSYKPAFIYGGPTVSVSMLCEHLVRGGISVQVFTTTANGDTELPVKTDIKQLIDDVPVIYFKRITKDHTHFSPSLLARLWANAGNYDLVHVHGWWNTVSMLSALIAVMRGVPLVISPRGMLSQYTFHNKNNGKKSLLHRFLGRRVLNKSFIHCTAQNECDAVCKQAKPKGVTSIPNFVKIHHETTSQAKEHHNGLKIIFFSRIEEKKGLDILFRALKYVEHPYHLTVAGDGEARYTEYLKTISEQEGINNNLNWVGFKTHDKFRYLSEFDLMVLPSHDENFGNVVVESLSVGTPVLISENVGLSDYVRANDLGWVFRLDDKVLGSAINQACVQKEKLSFIRSNAPDKIAEDFAPEILLKRYREMYKLVAES